MNINNVKPICLFLCLAINVPGQAQNRLGSIEELSAEINSYLIGSQCNRTAGARMTHPGESVLSVKPNGDTAYISRNYVKQKLTTLNVYKWNLTRIDKTEIFSMGECTILKVSCRTDDKCKLNWSVRDGELRGPFARDWSNNIYFADVERARRALKILQQLTLRIAKNPQDSVPSTDFPFPQSVLTGLLAEGGAQTDPSVKEFFEKLDDLVARKKQEPSKRYVPELTRFVRIDKGNRAVERFPDLYLENENTIVAVWAINNNWNHEWILRGALSDVVNILKGISKSGVSYSRISLKGTYGLDDVYGNKNETEVLRMTFSRQKVQQINWGNFRKKNLFVIADQVYMHPSWQN